MQDSSWKELLNRKLIYLWVVWWLKYNDKHATPSFLHHDQVALTHHSYSQSYFYICLYKAPQHQKPQMALHHRPQTLSTKHSNPKTQAKTPKPGNPTKMRLKVDQIIWAQDGLCQLFDTKLNYKLYWIEYCWVVCPLFMQGQLLLLRSWHQWDECFSLLPCRSGLNINSISAFHLHLSQKSCRSNLLT